MECLLPLLCWLGSKSNQMVNSQINFYRDTTQSIVRPAEYKKKQECDFIARELNMIDRTEQEKEKLRDDFLLKGCQW